MKKISILSISLIVACTTFAQDTANIITAKAVERIEKVLSADEMRGRRAFSPEIDKAAAFIAGEFASIGLKPYNNSNTYLQSFSMITPKLVSLSAKLDGLDADPKNVVVLTAEPKLTVTEASNYEKASIPAGSNFSVEATKYARSGKNYVVWVDTSYNKNFPRLGNFKRGMFKTAGNTIFILAAHQATKFEIVAIHEITENKLANVVGILPGKSRPNEYVIFSGHYDHIGVGKPVNGDSIYNGANDDAAGTTAMILLARYFKALGNNERTLVFAAFTAEEVGGFGSQYFSRQFDPEKVVAMFNIEMIGTESKWGRGSAYITGYEKTNMGDILGKNLEGSPFKFYPDPYTSEHLFYRSDNATLARLGVPAHTISTSKMDNEPNYHKVSDEIQTLDLENMAQVIKAIAISSRSIISGKDTPTRVNTADLN